ncbi:MAG TPA: MBL fold metallo-hydrolase [Bryobacteraceae bacterium]|nr:MBL fold metallo-hydrolase [Bryobacteraceae bacterium]
MNYTIHEVSDGGLDYPREAMLPKDPDPELEAQYPPVLSIPYRPVVIRIHGRTVLLDSGAGPLAPTTGKLEESLRQQAISPKTIDMVVLSQAHADHIGGLLREDGLPAFPNARIVIAREEYDFWRNSGIRDQLGTGSVYGNAMIEAAIGQWFNRYLLALESRLELVESDAEVIPGVRLMRAPGHTPGHCAVLVHAHREVLLFLADAFALPAQIQHPEWTSSFDLDAAETVQTRLALLDLACADECRVIHYHVPGIGRIVRGSSGYAWEADAPSMGAALTQNSSAQG